MQSDQNLSKLEQRRDELLRQISTRKLRRDIPTNILTAENIGRFAAAARKQLKDKDGVFRKQILRQFIERIEVRDDKTLIGGPKQSLANVILESTKPGTGRVPGFVSNWWARRDSNPRQLRYERSVLTS